MDAICHEMPVFKEHLTSAMPHSVRMLRAAKVVCAVVGKSRYCMAFLREHIVGTEAGKNQHFKAQISAFYPKSMLSRFTARGYSYKQNRPACVCIQGTGQHTHECFPCRARVGVEGALLLAQVDDGSSCADFGLFSTYFRTHALKVKENLYKVQRSGYAPFSGFSLREIARRRGGVWRDSPAWSALVSGRHAASTLLLTLLLGRWSCPRDAT